MLTRSEQHIIAKTVDGENIVLMGIMKHRPIPDKVNGGIASEIYTRIHFVDHDRDLWGEVVFSTVDHETYMGIISPILGAPHKPSP